MSENRLISLHPKLAAVCDGLFSFVSMVWLLKLTNPLFVIVWFIVKAGFWVALINFVYYPPYLNRYKHLAALILASIGITTFLVFSDPSNLFFAKILTIFITPISFWLIPARADSLSVMEKPHRRWKFFMSLFGVYGIWLAFFANTIFQIIQGQFIIWAVFLASFLVTAISIWEWIEYGEKFETKLFISAGILFLILFETSGIVFLWPVGYFVGSFLLTWFWYIIWLLFRFNFTTTGIDWKKQKFFLISNLVLLAIFLAFIVRWN